MYQQHSLGREQLALGWPFTHSDSMHLPDRHMRAWVSPFLGALLLSEALFLPGLERGEGARRAVLESEHSAATCVVGHDHTICIQTGANRAATSNVVRPQLPVVSP